MASIRQLTKPNREGKRPWVVEYTDPSGRRRRATPRSGLQKDAKALRTKIEGEIERGEHINASDALPLAEVCELFVRYGEDRKRIGKIGGARYYDFTSAVDRNIKPFFGQKKITDVSAEDVEAFFHYMCRDRGLRPISAYKRMGVLKQVFAFALKRKMVKVNPVHEAREEIGHIKREPIRTFASDDVLAVLATAKTKRLRGWDRTAAALEVIVNVAAFCGLRFGEIMGLQRGNVDLGRRLFRVRHNLSRYDGLKEPKTPSSVRDVPIPVHVAALLREWLDTHFIENELDLVFRTSTGTAIQGAHFHTHMWRPLLARAGLGEGDRFHFHALRHFTASYMIDCGWPVTEVAAMLGHAKVSVTLQTYAHAVANSRRRFEMMDEMAARLLAAPVTITVPASVLDLTPIPPSATN